MPGSKRRGLLPRRRRHDDEGEEDGSTAGDLAEYASSEGTITTDADEDGDVSDHTVDEEKAQSSTLSPTLTKQDASQQGQTFKTTTDTEAMLNGLKMENNEIEELHFDDATTNTGAQAKHTSEQRTKPQPATSSKPSPVTQASTSQRKGYFLHDDRANHQNTTVQGNGRGRGRAFGLPGNRGNFGSFGRDNGNKWTHDLHETVNQPEVVQHMNLPAPKATTIPNRSFSTTTVLGKVPVNVSLPGIEKKSSASMLKKHYTLLPQHRPPLRRDKPVRISIPEEHPRYIFPSTERSFIFIPRAMRPNQQQFRGRARGSFNASRRTSMYGGSTYTPSIGMSRRPSFAASNSGSGVHTPTGPTFPPYQMGMQKPVVRMPFPNIMPFIPTAQHVDLYSGDNPAIIYSPPATLPMHQPIPQKTVSVAGIESPAMTAPQQQSQQPFHQQVPTSLQESQQKMPHIPEGAVYAQPFQPYPAMHQPGYYGMPYTQTPTSGRDAFIR